MRMGTRLCNIVEKAFQSKEQPRSSPKIIQPSPSVYTGLHICPHQEVEIIFFSFRAIRPNSPSPQSSQGPQRVFEFYPDRRKRRQAGLGEQVSGTCGTWSDPKPTHWRSGGPFLSRGPRGSHGHVPVERTHRSARPLHWVGKGGQLLAEDFLTNLNHVLSWEAGSLWNKGYIITTSITGSASTTGHVIRNIPRQDMPEQWLPWEKMQRADEAITDSLAQVGVHVSQSGANSYRRCK